LGASSAGAIANNASFRPSISADGRWVAFESLASNLVAGDTISTIDVFLHDSRSGRTQRLSVTTAGVQANGPSFAGVQPSISLNGRYVVFYTDATNLVAGDTNASFDVMIRDLKTRTTHRVSVSSTGAQGDNASFLPSISADGRYVALASLATHLVAGDTNGLEDVFVRGPLHP